MKYSSYIDNITIKAWGINISQAYIFDWLYTLPSWADTVLFEGKNFYFASRHKAIEELPNLTDKPDTVYRYYKKLEEFGLIELIKIKSKDYIRITEKGAQWGRKHESEHSEKNPNKLGNISETNSEKNPTNKYISNNKNTSNKKGNKEDLFPTHDPNKKTLFRNSVLDDYNLFEKKFSEPEFQDIDLAHYFHAVRDWSDSANKKRTARGWLATARTFMRGDKEKGKLKTKNSLQGNNSEEMLNFLKRR